MKAYVLIEAGYNYASWEEDSSSFEEFRAICATKEIAKREALLARDKRIKQMIQHSGEERTRVRLNYDAENADPRKGELSCSARVETGCDLGTWSVFYYIREEEIIGS